MIAGGTKHGIDSQTQSGPQQKGAPYYIQFLDHEGKRRTTKGCPDKGVTEAKAAKIETAVQRIKIGLAEQSELDELLERDCCYQDFFIDSAVVVNPSQKQRLLK